MTRDGIRAVTHRAVAAELGHSLRATTYYFASIDELIEAVFLRYVERSLARFGAIEDALPPHGLTVEAAARALAELAREDVPDEVAAAYHGARPTFGREYIIPTPFDPRLISFVPPLVVTRDELDEALAILGRVFEATV